jgi:hypothetical protein
MPGRARFGSFWREESVEVPRGGSERGEMDAGSLVAHLAATSRIGATARRNASIVFGATTARAGTSDVRHEAFRHDPCVAMAGHSGALNTSRTVVPDPVSNEDVRQRANLLTIAALSIACSAGPLPTPPPGPGVPRPDTRQTRSVDPVVFPEAFSLSLTQEFGYAPMRYCTLEVAIYQPSRVALECLHQNGVVTRAGRDLRAEESEQIFKFARGADLFQGGHSGDDLTLGDGTLETLKVRAAETGRAVVLITS